MDLSEIKEIAEISGSELLEKSKSIEKIGDIKEILREKISEIKQRPIRGQNRGVQNNEQKKIKVS